MKKILGIDISSSCIGYALLSIDDDNKITFNECNYLIPSKKGTIMDRLIDTRDKMKKIIEDFQPDYIGIEDLIKFMPKSTATTVVVLTTFNRMICLLAYDFLKAQPNLLNVMSIRHGLKLNKILPKKEEMPELVSQHLGITFPYVYKNSKKKGKTINEVSNDMADAVAVALFYAFQLTGKTKPKKTKKVKK